MNHSALKTTKELVFTVAILTLLFWSTTYANVIIPTVALIWGSMVITIPFIVLLESLILYYFIKPTNILRLILKVFLANLLTTIIGVIIVFSVWMLWWIFTPAFDDMFWYSNSSWGLIKYALMTWNIFPYPYREWVSVHWLNISAIILWFIYTIGCYLLSAYVEYRLLYRWYTNLTLRQSLIMHTVSYIALSVISLILLYTL